MCPSGSTLDFSAAGPWFEPRCSGRRSRGAAARAKASVGWGGSLPSCVGGGVAHCCRWLGSFSFSSYVAVHQLSEAIRQGNTDGWLKEAYAGGGEGGSPRSGEAGGGEHCYVPGSNRRSMR